MLTQRVAQGGKFSIESQWAIKACNDFDYAFELTETKRFDPGEPIVQFLQSLRDAGSARGRFVEVELWKLFKAVDSSSPTPSKSHHPLSVGMVMEGNK